MHLFITLNLLIPFVISETDSRNQEYPIQKHILKSDKILDNDHSQETQEEMERGR
jgi:hypothetical protein